MPIHEETQVSYASCHPGLMHACGHDGHSAALLGLARRIKDKKLKYNIILIFQNSEESGSGAKSISSYLKSHYHIDAIFGFHIMPYIKKHHIVSSHTTMMYASEEIDICIKGKMSHVGLRNQGIDSIQIASQLLFQYRSLNTSSSFIHIGKISGGNARNIVCDFVKMKGTLRAKDEESLKKLKEQINLIHHTLIKYNDCKIESKCRAFYPAVKNNELLYKKLSTFLPLYLLENPYMLSEDFSYYQKDIPSVFMFIGTGSTSFLHTSYFNFDESILITMIDTYEKIIMNL